MLPGESGGRRKAMKSRLRWMARVVCVTAMAMMMWPGVRAARQAAPAASAPPDMTPVANPVSGFVKAGVARYQKNMVAAAEAMPAEKYGFRSEERRVGKECRSRWSPDQ